MRVLNWNILSGGGNRVGSITEQIRDHFPDVCVLTEFRFGKSGNEISEKLHTIGYKYKTECHAEPSQNSVIIFSKRCFDEAALDIQVPEAIKCHIVCTQIDSIIFIGAFCATPEIGTHFIQFLCDLADQYPGRSILAAGDLFFGARASNVGFYKPLEALNTKGWRNSWELLRGKEVVWSFQGGRGKSQPDHIYLYGPITEAIVQIDFSMDELDKRISDHALMIANFNLKQCGIGVDGASLAYQNRSIPNLDDPCGKNFTYRDFIECGETQAISRPSSLSGLI